MVYLGLKSTEVYWIEQLLRRMKSNTTLPFTWGFMLTRLHSTFFSSLAQMLNLYAMSPFSAENLRPKHN